MPRTRQPQLNDLAEPEARLTPEAAGKGLAALVFAPSPGARTFGDAFAIMRLEKPQIMAESLGHEVRQVIAAGLGAPE